MDSFYYEYLILPILIFLARIADQSVGTLRLILLAKGMKFWVPILGFCEVIIWLLAVGQIINDLTNWIAIIAYGLGFAMGNIIGIKLDEKLMLGTVVVRIIPKFDTTDLINALAKLNFGVTTINAEGTRGPVKIVLSIIKRKDLPTFTQIINNHNPNAFYTVEDVRSVYDGVFRSSKRKSALIPGTQITK